MHHQVQLIGSRPRHTVRGLSVWTCAGWDRVQCGVLGGEVEALHGTQVVDGARRPSVSSFHVCRGQEAVPRTGQRGVAVSVSKDEVWVCEGKEKQEI